MVAHFKCDGVDYRKGIFWKRGCSLHSCVRSFVPTFKVIEWHKISYQITGFCLCFGPYMAVLSWARHLASEGIEQTGHYMTVSSRETSLNSQKDCLWPYPRSSPCVLLLHNPWHYIEVTHLRSCYLRQTDCQLFLQPKWVALELAKNCSSGSATMASDMQVPCKSPTIRRGELLQRGKGS